MQYQTIWISDVHLGSPNCEASQLVDFLRENTADTLCLVGDILDITAMEKKPYWDKHHSRVVEEILWKAKQGRVYYIPGNHDAGVREHFGQVFSGIEVYKEDFYTTQLGKQLLVIHGDVVDPFDPNSGGWIKRLGHAIYGFTPWLNRAVNSLTSILDKPYFGVNTWLKNHIPVVRKHVSDFEEAALAYARQRGFHGVICGHIHVPRLENDLHSFYGNCGDWIENCTALVEHVDGRFEIVNWRDLNEPSH